jgi:hypothetical protein
MRAARSIGAALAVVLAAATGLARAQPDIVYGTQIGTGPSWLDHPAARWSFENGTVWDVVLGVALDEHWTMLLEMTSWQDAFLGTPAHLHSFGARGEWHPAGLARGPYTFASLGAGLTDGDVDKRAGFAAGAGGGWLVPLLPWLSVGLELAVRVHAYDDGDAGSANAAVVARFAGDRDVFATSAAGWTQSVFLAVGLGAGLAAIEHEQIDPGFAPGWAWDAVFGWSIDPRWAPAIQLTTWQTGILGTPYHLHTLDARVEWCPAVRGWCSTAAAGLATTDGDVRKRAGAGGSLATGWRWRIGPADTLTASIGVRAHVYPEGATAIQPSLTVELRTWGATESVSSESAGAAPDQED